MPPFYLPRNSRAKDGKSALCTSLALWQTKLYILGVMFLHRSAMHLFSGGFATASPFSNHNTGYISGFFVPYRLFFYEGGKEKKGFPRR